MKLAATAVLRHNQPRDFKMRWQHSLSLLKIEFGTSEGRYKQHRATSPILCSSTLIAMMQAANLREGNNVIACEG
jgi:hypothetical protein